MASTNLYTMIITTLLVLMVPVASVTASFYDRGRVKVTSSGQPADVTVKVDIYDQATGGTLLATASGTSNNGVWDILVGPVDLEFSKKYWKDYTIGGEDVDFGSDERKAFYSTWGGIKTGTFLKDTTADLVVDPTTHKVGIGTSTPSEMLEVAGNVKATGTATLATVDIDAGAIDGATIGANSATTGKFTTSYATTFDTDVAAAGVTLAGTTLAADGTDTNINIAITPKGTGEVDITKVDIDAGAIDSTAIGGTTPAAGSFTTLGASGATTLSGTLDITDNLVVVQNSPSASVDGGILVKRYQTENDAGTGDVVAGTAAASSTAQAGAASTITLASGSSAVDDFYNNWYIKITNNDPAGVQNLVRKITDYDGTGKVATVNTAWGATNPTSDTTYSLYDTPFVGVIYDESADEVALAATATDPGTATVTITDHAKLHVGGLTVDDALDVDSATTLDQVTIDTTDGDFAVSGSNAITLTSTKDAASAVLITANAGTSETIKIHADQGTGTASINLASDAGGITLDTGSDDDIALTAGADINIPASVGLTFGDDGEKIEGDGTDLTMQSSGNLNIVSSVNEADAIYLRANAGTSETIKIHADAGTGTDSINLVSDSGGIKMVTGVNDMVEIGTDGSNYGFLRLAGYAGGSATGGRFYLGMANDHDTTYNEWAIRVNEDDLQFNRGTSSNVVTLTAEAEVGIGTSDPTYLLDMHGSDSVLEAARIFNTYNGNNADGLQVQIGYTGDLGSGNNFMTFAKGSGTGTLIGQIEGDGSGGVVYQTSSDARLKENVVDTRYGLEDIMQVKVRDFNFIGSDSTTTGFVAQELYEAYPVAVSVGSDYVEEEPWGVDYGRLTPLLVQAVQDLKAENDALKAIICQDHPDAEICT
ncbi:MAG: tail fiber domain-containing protein [Candidatus Undinarchaeales archaeon]|jgi:hypothetical protein|nr:tail fiber domain-containing protein [Candidatus Undinarchaeales archaeon]